MVTVTIDICTPFIRLPYDEHILSEPIMNGMKYAHQSDLDRGRESGAMQISPPSPQCKYETLTLISLCGSAISSAPLHLHFDARGQVIFLPSCEILQTLNIMFFRALRVTHTPLPSFFGGVVITLFESSLVRSLDATLLCSKCQK